MHKIVSVLKHFLSKKRYRRGSILLVSLLLFLYYPIKKPLVRDDYSKVITDKNGGIMRVFLAADQQYCLPPEFNDKIPEKLKQAVIHFEDRHFFRHPGVNPVSVIRAIIQNIKEKEIVSGASTITMQLTRIRKGRSRNVKNKLLEMLEAFRIEAQYNKSDILKLYLDHAPYGGNIIGYQAASWRYFGKPPEKLSWAQASLLAVLPNSPGAVSPVKNSERLFQKRNALIKSLFLADKIDSSTYSLSIDEPMPKRVIPFDLRAPHLTRRIEGETSAKKNIVRTSVDAEVQDKANYLVKRYSRSLQHYGIENAAVVVVENETHKVRAYIGSQDFYGKAGRVDGVNALRSSGSLLKPFLYALCMHDGIILPETKLQDIPTYYGTFAPSNASELNDGMVSAQDALVRSLNVPAVRLLYTYGHYRFYNFLKDAGITTLHRSADDYGLPLIIGGAEVTLSDMAAAYSSLANLGEFGPISYYEDNTVSENPMQLIDTLSTVMCLNILNKLQRPGAENYWNRYNSQYPIAWKTGTSYGHKDAWAVGINPEWTVAVWVGNFDATTNKNLGGASSAGPLMFDIFNSLSKDPLKKWWKIEDFNYPLGDICAVSGYAAGRNCPESVERIVPVSDALKVCPYHISAEVDSVSQYRVCSRCWDKGHHTKHFVSYPPLVLSYLRKNGTVIEKVPPHNPKCQFSNSGNTLSLEYPKHNSKIFIARDFDGAYQPVVFTAVHQLKNQSLYWYIDNKYYGQTSSKHKLTVFLEPGEHQLSIIDSYGNKKQVTFYSTLKRGEL